MCPLVAIHSGGIFVVRICISNSHVSWDRKQPTFMRMEKVWYAVTLYPIPSMHGQMYRYIWPYMDGMGMILHGHGSQKIQCRRCLDHSVSACPWLTFFCQADTTVFLETSCSQKQSKPKVYKFIGIISKEVMFLFGRCSRMEEISRKVSPFLYVEEIIAEPPKRKRSRRVCLFSI